LLFHEYFHGDNGAGLGASHQTGWTGLVARVIQVRGYLRPEDLKDNALRGHLVFGKAPSWPPSTPVEPGGRLG
jgi:hypothetical protein